MFEAFRAPPWPTLYGPSRTPVTSDITVASLLYCIAILLISLLIVVPGSRKGQKFYCLIRVTVCVYVGGAIMVCNYGQEWEVASVSTRTPYRAGTSQQINATIRVKIGLRSINITLTGLPPLQTFHGSMEETIDYNERFSWDNQGWDQGLLGFGPRAGLFNQEFRMAQLRGVPFPILWTAEYFTIDGEGIRWGRFYRQAGFFTHMAMWSALPLWIMSLVLFSLVPSYGAVYSVLTGLDLFAACLLFTWIRNPQELVIPFEDGRLVFTWGWCYWVTLITGIICLCFGMIVYLAEMRYPDEVFVFFGRDILSEYDEIYISEPGSIGQEYNKSQRPGRMTSLDRPASSCQSPLQLMLSSQLTISNSLEDDSFSTADTLESSLIVPAREEGRDLEDAEDFDTVIADTKEYKQVFRKRPNSAQLLWKHTTGWRRGTPSPVHPHSVIQPDSPTRISVEREGLSPDHMMTQSRSDSAWSSQSPLHHPTIHRRRTEGVENTAFICERGNQCSHEGQVMKCLSGPQRTEQDMMNPGSVSGTGVDSGFGRSRHSVALASLSSPLSMDDSLNQVL